MSRIYRISLICVMAVALMILCILIFRYKEQQLDMSDQSGKGAYSSDNMADLQYRMNYSKIPDSTVPVLPASEIAEVTTADTELILIEHFPEGLSRQSQRELPADLVGCNRNDMNRIIESYCNAPDQIDLEKGLYRIEMTSFSEQFVTIEKSYHKNVTEYYYLAFVDDYVTVFYEDKKTILLTTDIHSNQLPKAVCEEIMNYKLIIGNVELFDFLETYTS